MKSKLTRSSKIFMMLSLGLAANLSWATITPTKLTNDKEQTPASVTSTTLSDDIEIIDVVGERPLLYFKKEVGKAELDFYDTFNILAKEKKFIVRCRREKRLGSNISSKVCHPQFVLDRMAQETQDALQTGAPFPSWDDIEFAVREEQAESIAYVEKLVKENPQLLNKLIALNDKQSKYEAKKNESR
ncbi:MAG: hypothetical protein ACI9LE_001880 [Paraglaciecola sp.]|jgi:hypothetical protein